MYISCGLLRASHSRNPHRYSHSEALAAQVPSCSYRFASGCPAICPCRHGHLPGRPESLYSKLLYDTLCHIVYKLRVAPCFALSQPSPVFALPRCAYAHRFLLIPVCLQLCAYMCVRCAPIYAPAWRAYKVNPPCCQQRHHLYKSLRCPAYAPVHATLTTFGRGRSSRARAAGLIK